MSKEINGELLSDFEIILPWDVIETCCNLKPLEYSCFVSENVLSQTNNQLFISKLEDNSIKVRITVTSLTQNFPNSANIMNKEENKITENASESSFIDGNKDNLSTIIIVKSNSPMNNKSKEMINDVEIITQKEDNNSTKKKEQSLISNKKSIVKYKKDKLLPPKAAKPAPALSGKKDGECVVQCELCGDAVVGYGPLYKHVRWAHGEGTFVQNYLDELRPLVKSWAVEQHKKSQYRQNEFFSSFDFVDSSQKEKKIKKDLNNKKSTINNSTPTIILENKTVFPKKQYHCKSCGADFLTLHRKQEHEKKCSKILHFVCEFCTPQKQFATRKKMLRHVHDVHVGKRATPHMLKGVNINSKFSNSDKNKTEKGNRKPSASNPGSKQDNGVDNSTSSSSSLAATTTNNELGHSCDLCQEKFASLNLLVCHSKYCRFYPVS